MRITHPHPALGRQKFIGIEFRDGVAKVESLHPEVETALLQHGFSIEDEPIIDLTSLKVSELRDLARAESIDVPAKASKADLVDILSRTPVGPALGRDGQPSGEQITVEDLEKVAEVGRSLPEDFIAQAWTGQTPEIRSED